MEYWFDVVVQLFSSTEDLNCWYALYKDKNFSTTFHVMCKVYTGVGGIK